MSGIWDPVRRRLSAAAAGSGWCQVLERGACWWCLMLASRDDVESGDFTRATGIPSTSIEERDDKRLGRSRVPDGFTPVLDPAVPTTGFPIVSADDIDVATCSRTITHTRANGTTVTRYRRDVHGVIVEVAWYPGPDGAPVIGHCYPLCGAGVIVNSPQGPVAAP